MRGNDPSNALREEEQPDLGVQWLAYGLSEIQYHWDRLAYARLARRWAASGRKPAYFNYAYAFLWTIGLIVLTTLAAVTPWALPFAVIASARYFEVAVWYFKLLFDSTHAKILSPERNLLFLLVDSAASVVVVGLWLAAATTRASEAAPLWSAALSTFTLNGSPDGYEGWRASVATGLGSFGGLLLIGAGLALLVGLLSKRFSHGQPEEYTGPLRLPKPTGKPWDRQSAPKRP